jgi:hypothetical protein
MTAWRADEHGARAEAFHAASPRLVLIGASVAAAAVVVAVVVAQLPGHGSRPAAAPATTGAARTAPACPALGPRPVAAPLRVTAGKPLDVSVEIAPARADRQITGVTLVLVPPGQGVTDPDMVLARSPELTVTAGQERLSSALPIPADLAAGRYDLVADTAFPGPSLCGVPNPATPPFYGREWVELGRVTVDRN